MDLVDLAHFSVDSAGKERRKKNPNFNQWYFSWY